MKYKNLILIFCLLIMMGCMHNMSNEKKKEVMNTLKSEDSIKKYSLKSKSVAIPDEKTAISIAEPLMVQKYGKEMVESEKPLQATLIDNKWVVIGTLPEDTLGGTVRVDINREDGTILLITHEE